MDDKTSMKKPLFDYGWWDKERPTNLHSARLTASTQQGAGILSGGAGELSGDVIEGRRVMDDKTSMKKPRFDYGWWVKERPTNLHSARLRL